MRKKNTPAAPRKTPYTFQHDSIEDARVTVHAIGYDEAREGLDEFVRIAWSKTDMDDWKLASIDDDERAKIEI